MAKKTITTARLMKMLETSPGKFCEKYVVPNDSNLTFQEYLISLMQKHNFSTTDLISYACISKTYAYQLVNGERLPGRDILIRIALVMSLDIDTTNRLLTLAEKNILYPKIRRDAGILFCLSKKMDLNDTNELLNDLGENLLL